MEKLFQFSDRFFFMIPDRLFRHFKVGRYFF